MITMNGRDALMRIAGNDDGRYIEATCLLRALRQHPRLGDVSDDMLVGWKMGRGFHSCKTMGNDSHREEWLRFARNVACFAILLGPYES